MRKSIKVDQKDYYMQSSAYTQFAYKEFTGRSFLNDLQSVIKLKNKKEGYVTEDLDNVTELLLKITYVMIVEADDKQVEDYKSFVKSIESLYDDDKWIEEVILLACTPISRQLQKN